MGISISGGVKVPQGKFKVYVAPAPAAPTGKSLWMMGQNLDGNLGLGDVNDRSSPVQVGLLADWTTVSTNDASLAVKIDGTLWSWGDNTPYGRLGLGDVNDRSSPVQVGNLTTWTSVSAGRTHSTALKTDGTLWTWGDNGEGRLGQGDAGGGTSKSSPVQVGLLSDWTTFNSGQDSTLAIKTDGTLWAWGWAREGQLANGSSTINHSSPVQIGSSSNWTYVSRGGLTIAAINTIGELWVWGRGTSGQMGQGDNVSRSSPVQIGSATDWASASVGSSRCAAIKTDGTLWSWGQNGTGQLGLGDTADRSSPVQVGGLTDWASIDCGSNTILAIKTNGTLWSWGQAVNGRLGLGDTIQRSSPVQVGSLTTWSSVSSGISSSMLRNE